MALATVDKTPECCRSRPCCRCSRWPRPTASKAATYILVGQREAARDIIRDHIVRRYDGLLLVRRALSGAVSGIMSMAKSPAALATSMYQAGASALPVRWISQVTTG